ncbi:hypothetical protein ACFCY9_12565 [Streptomyces fimicarius]
MSNPKRKTNSSQSAPQPTSKNTVLDDLVWLQKSRERRLAEARRDR